MNNERRKAIQQLIDGIHALTDYIETAKSSLDSIVEDLGQCAEEEREYFDNMPESMQGSDKGEAADQAATQLEEAQQELQELLDALDADLIGVIAKLEEAKA